MSTIRFSLVYNRKNRLNKNNEALIQIKAYHSKIRNGSNTRYFGTGIYVSPENWDKKNNRVINHDLEFHYNFTIQKALQDLSLKYTDIFKRYGQCSLDDLSRDSETSYLTFLEFAQQEIDNSDKKKSTKTAQENTLAKLKSFRSQVHFSDLNFAFIEKFDLFLKRSKLSLTTIWKHHKDIKFFVNQAVKKDLLRSYENPYIRFKVSRGIPKTRDFLELNEIEKLESLKFPTEELYLERIRDLFLMGCYTGLRFSDLSKLKLSNFKEETNRVSLTMQSVKTNKFLELDLSLLFKNTTGRSKPELLYFKYKEMLNQIYGASSLNKYLFNGLTNQHCNRELKIIAERAKISKTVSTHVARTSFGTNMAMKIPTAVLKELMQHSKIATTEIYINLSKKMINESLSKVQW